MSLVQRRSSNGTFEVHLQTFHSYMCGTHHAAVLVVCLIWHIPSSEQQQRQMLSRTW